MTPEEEAELAEAVLRAETFELAAASMRRQGLDFLAVSVEEEAQQRWIIVAEIVQRASQPKPRKH